MGLKKFFNKLVHGDVDKRHADGETRLYTAVRQGNIMEVKQLLQKRKANPNIPNNHGMTPLHVAAYWGETGIVELLLKADADPNANTGKGWTPMHSAALAGGMRGRKAIIERLRKAGAKDDDVRDRNGMTAADYILLWRDDAAAAAKMQELIANQSAKYVGPCPKCGKAHGFCGPSAPKHQ